jgi:UDP-N-acetylmuramyl-tripeptide synthetase
MKLTDLLNEVRAIQVVGDAVGKEVSSIEFDSRQVGAGAIFAAVRGFQTDGHKYVQSAVAQGAAAVVVDRPEAIPEHMTERQNFVGIVVRDSRVALAELARAFYGDPSRELTLVGVTGTKGKTTSVYYSKSIFDQAGKRAGLVGTIANIVGDRVLPAERTTPEATEINRLLREMRDVGCEAAAMEVSSHALELSRTNGLEFDAAIFTNLAGDHLDFHKTTEAYAEAKKRLFDGLAESSVAVVNADDQYAELMARDVKGRAIRYGVAPDSDVWISDVESDLNGTRATLTFEENDYRVNSKLIGDFNASNFAGAFAAAVGVGIAPETAVRGIEATEPPPGRFQTLRRGEKIVVVDYSHTADSLEQALRNLRKIAGEQRKIVTVVGCGGDRDKTKRPVMCGVATRLSDVVVITSDNPRTEDPQSIIDDMLVGVEANNHVVEPDREAAIKRAVQESDDDAVVLVAGKGHETYQEINGVKNHFSDVEKAEKYL